MARDSMPMNKPNAFRAVVGLLRFFVITLAIMPLQAIALLLRRPAAKLIPFQYHRTVCAMLGIKIETYGSAVCEGPVLLVTNHTSWLDIPILSAIAPLSFVAKREVRDWPFFGALAKLQRTVFIERAKRTDTKSQRDQILSRLAQGDALVLFPEGTSGDGNRVLPFNSALFSVAEQEIDTPHGPRPVTVQPISVAYVRFQGLPMGRRLRPKFAWYGGMSLLPHLFDVFGFGPMDVVIHIHEPVTVRKFRSRKTLAAHCQRAVAAGVAHALVGRPETLAPLYEENEPLPAEAEPITP